MISMKAVQACSKTNKAKNKIITITKYRKQVHRTNT